MRRRRAWIVVALFLLAIGGAGIRWAHERRAGIGLTDSSAAGMPSKDATVRSRPPPREQSPEFKKIREKLERIRIDEFYLNGAPVPLAVKRLRELIREREPDQRIRIKAVRDGPQVSRYLRTNDDIRRGNDLLWPQRDYHLNDLSAWQVLERMASDYSMVITVKDGDVLLVPKGAVAP